jgi:chromosome segregation ATPase
MAVSMSGSTTLLSKHNELVGIVGVLAASSISAEHYTNLESLVDSVVERCDRSDECIDNLKKQVKANAEELKRIISKEKELDNECTKFQEMITDKTKKKNSKNQQVFDSQLFVLNAMSNECKTYKVDLHKLSTAISKELRENLFQIINVYLTTELEV